jgi:hypothetical protein
MAGLAGRRRDPESTLPDLGRLLLLVILFVGLRREEAPAGRPVADRLAEKARLLLRLVENAGPDRRDRRDREGSDLDSGRDLQGEPERVGRLDRDVDPGRHLAEAGDRLPGDADDHRQGVQEIGDQGAERLQDRPEPAEGVEEGRPELHRDRDDLREEVGEGPNALEELGREDEAVFPDRHEAPRKFQDRALQGIEEGSHSGSEKLGEGVLHVREDRGPGHRDFRGELGHRPEFLHDVLEDGPRLFPGGDRLARDPHGLQEGPDLALGPDRSHEREAHPVGDFVQGEPRDLRDLGDHFGELQDLLGVEAGHRRRPVDGLEDAGQVAELEGRREGGLPEALVSHLGLFQGPRIGRRRPADRVERLHHSGDGELHFLDFALEGDALFDEAREAHPDSQSRGELRDARA